MKKIRTLFCYSLITLLTACGEPSNKPIDKPKLPDLEIPIEIGDSVKKWYGALAFNKLPMGVNTSSGNGRIVNDLGNRDKSSLSFELTKDGYIGTDLAEEAFFKEDDAKNGDLISLSVYLPSGHNIKTLKLEAVTSNNSTVSGETIDVDDTYLEVWKGLEITYDTLDTLGSIRLSYTLLDKSTAANIYIDDIDIVLGEETVITDYSANDESLYKSFEEYFKVGTCMSGSMIKNTELRRITKDNFNSITAENEAKPEQILDQQACQAEVSSDPAAVCITTKPFEKIYDWAAKNHIGVRHHTFVWYSQTPSWFFTVDYTQNGARASRELMLQRMENFIKVTLETINERWPNVVYAVDVANEAVENGQIRSNNNNWYTSVGDDFVYYAFKYASQYKAEWQDLYYNDFAFDYQPNYCRFCLDNILNRAIEEGLIDGVGLQAHLDSNANFDNIINDAKMIKEIGLKCQITELDITVSGSDESAFRNQGNAYKNLVKKILVSNASGETDINAFIVWGITDNLSWKSYQNPLLFTQNYGKKPCYHSVLEALAEYIEENE